MDRLKGKVAIVTGGALRIGAAISRVFAREGAAVAILDVDSGAGEALAAAIRDAGGKAAYWQVNVADEAAVGRAIGEIAARFGKVDVLINNASVGGPDSATEDVSEAQWDAVMAVNVKGVFFCTKHAVPLMRHAGGGAIVNVSSIYGMVSSPHLAAFHASKGAVRIMTKTDALSFAPDRIRVNSVLPGFIWGSGDDDAEADGVAPEMARNATAGMTPLGNVGEPNDVAYAVLYLASDEAKFVTGSELVIDGGYTAG
jgi:NAD(P)-dependent dehydrogenase (short-subunit alcohol dehydrogenase family)